MTGKLDGKVAIITGAGQGMGANHAEYFVREGAKVILTDMDEQVCGALADSLGDAAYFVRQDVSLREGWDEVVADAQRHFGSIDILVNNAGRSGPVSDLLDLPVDDYLASIAVNQTGIFYGMRAVAPSMIAGGAGSIVNISSIAGKRATGTTTNIGYTASKFAVLGMTRQAAVDLGRHGIRVNAVLPGRVDTAFGLAVRAARSEEENARNLPPLGRGATLDEVSQAVAFLASDEAAFISGAEIVVDGGRLA